MEEPSTLSVATANQSGQVSVSNSGSFPFVGIKRPMEEAEACHPRLKGVVSQHNGHWGAQIYANYKRIWLGTFKSEKEAAMAYDSAAIKLRNGELQRNFPWTDITIHEPSFQSQFSTEEILNMLKDGSYMEKFSEYLRTQIPQGYALATFNEGNTKMRELFRKELTPSDVGKLNRLVIPKKYAVKYFPPISEVEEGEIGGCGMDDVELVFFDRSMRSWKFRYCYWKSSQSFVFTRGWNRFVKEKSLRAKDRVIFFVYNRDTLRGMKRLCIIDVDYCDDRKRMDGGISDGNKNELSLRLEIGLPIGNAYEGRQQKLDLKGLDFEWEENELENDCGKVEDNVGLEKGIIKLFGVTIA